MTNDDTRARLRDEMAMAALSGLCSHWFYGLCVVLFPVRITGQWAYKLADSMLAAREEGSR